MSYSVRTAVAWMIALLTSGVLAAQQRGRGNSDPNIESGSRIYAANCSRCHGEGDQIAGVDLRKGQFRHVAPGPNSDAELANLIRNGIPGTAMPSNSFTSFEIAGVVAYIRSMRDFEAKPVEVGDAHAGQILFEGKGNCGSCHRVNGKGSRIALDLSEVGASRSAAYLQRALLDPNAVLVPQNRFIRAVTREGTTITGRRLNEDTESVQLIDEKERLVSLEKSELRSYAVLTESPMPSYRDKFTSKEIADMVGYLASLKGAGTR